MDIKLEIRDIRSAVLDYDRYRQRQAPLLQGVFEFWGQPRRFSDPRILSDCAFFDLFITAYVREWGPHPPPPHPGIFEDFFARILARLIGSNNILTLFIQSTDRDSFDELEVVDTLLAPKGLPYVLFSKPPVPIDPRLQSMEPPLRLSVGYLIFQWPVDLLDDIVRRWFMTPTITIEGYISRESPLACLAGLHFKPDTEERLRELLRTIEMGFRVWPDNNGLLVLTDKLDLAALQERLQIASLNQMLQKAAPRYGMAP
jgi:hypothetical protein